MTLVALIDYDLINEISSIHKTKNVIIMLDANEDVMNSSFNDTMNNLGLRNVIFANTGVPMPPTHHQGIRAISTIYASVTLTVIQAGVLPIGRGVHGDHKNLYVDFNTQSFMGDSMYMVIPPPMKPLHMKDSRICKKITYTVNLKT